MPSDREHKPDTAGKQGLPGGAEVPSPAEVIASARATLETFKAARARMGDEAAQLENLREKMEADRERQVRELQVEKSQHRQDIEVQRQELADKMADLERRQESVSEMLNQMEADKNSLFDSMRELEDRKKELEQERSVLASSVEELDERERQITRREQDLAELQRGLERLTDSQRRGGDQQASPAPVETSKPAAATTADQFRKLRRDAKRRAIGI